MNKENIENLINTTKEDVDFAIKLSDNIIEDRTSDLDALMTDIQKDIVQEDNPDDRIIEKYLAELTNALYFINTRVEYFGFYEDITKANARDKYNKSYSEFQMNATSAGKKTTIADNQLYAETNSLDETMLNLIYSRSNKIIRGKIETASEMIKTLSKMLSVHMNEAVATKLATKIE